MPVKILYLAEFNLQEIYLQYPQINPMLLESIVKFKNILFYINSRFVLLQTKSGNILYINFKQLSNLLKAFRN